MIKDLLNKPIIHIFLIVMLTLLAYSNTFQNSFQFDDRPFIIENPITKNLEYFAAPSKAGAFEHLYQYEQFKHRFTTYLTFALNYKFHNLNVTGYHIVNLLIHIINALLIYLLVFIIFKSIYFNKSFAKNTSKQIAITAALLFVCHPIQTQAVTYITQRFASLTTMFYLFSIVMYIKARLSYLHLDNSVKSPKLRPAMYYLFSISSAILAMESKEIAFTLPIVIMVYELIFFEGDLKKRILYLIPLLLTMLIIPLSYIGTDKAIGELIGDVGEASRVQTDMSRLDYLFTEFRVIMTYIRLLFLPINQNLDYDYPIFNSFFNTEVFLSFIVLSAIFILAFYIFYRYRNSSPLARLIIFCILWFFITLSVESSVIPIVDVIFEHRMYLPSIGVFILISASSFIVVERFKDKFKGINRLTALAFVMIILILAGTTYARNNVWKDELSLWRDVISKSPMKERGHRNLGMAYRSGGFIDKAIEEYRIAIKLDPYSAQAYNNIGFAYYSKGLIGEAIENYSTAIALNPMLYKGHNNIGIAYAARGDISKAIEHYLIAIRLKPDFAEGYNLLGECYVRKGLIERGLEQFKTAIELKADFLEAHNNLGNVYALKGEFDKAINHFKSAIKLNPDIPDIHYNLGLAYWTKGQNDKAIEHFETAVKLRPDAEAYNALGNIYLSQELLNQAIESYKAAIGLKPGWEIPYYNLARAYFKGGHIAESRKELEQALKINPQYDKARNLLIGLSG